MATPTTKNFTDLLPYEVANRKKLPIHADEYGHLDGLYFWGCLHDSWQAFSEQGLAPQYEYKIDSFRCTDPWLALNLVAAGYAIVDKIDFDDPKEKVVMLLMKRVY